MANRRSLVVELEDREATVGQPFQLRVRTSSHRPIDGATVTTMTGSKRAITDANGRCQLTFRSPGFWKLLAIAPETDCEAYRPATELVRAVTSSATTQRARRALVCRA
ncbi:carboxypeptidase regulatory-like domain-containing protein [Natrialba sp. PRR66]|uniref:carboxypeptidase regulatory-like domain-containing protein n=1 Tax=Natrialba sp. PRR66 TaxID=3098146 RepID=UPI002B1DAC7D|nr:carboxypeptidase regulatory-like domain-containing protein [Natrialba sp. PRR66]